MSFEAKYSGVCTACDERITPGERVEYGDGDRVQHVECPPDPEPRPVCPNCFMEIALNGMCSC